MTKSLSYAALHYYEYGSAKMLKSEVVEKIFGNLKPKSLRVQVFSISINPVDLKILSGEQKLFMSRTFPKTFGTDFFGRVLGVGATISTFSEGDWIIGMTNPLVQGSGQEILDLPSTYCTKVTPDVSDAAGLPGVGITVLRSLSMKELVFLGQGAVFNSKSVPGPGSGKRVLIIGANGGVGSLAVQVFRFLGYEVHGTGRKALWSDLRSLGVTHFYDREELPTDKKFEVILDCPGILGPKEVRSLARNWSARYIPVSIPNKKILYRLFQSLVYRPFFSTTIVLAVPSQSLLTLLGSLRLEGLIRSPIVDRFPLSQVQDALKLSLSGGVVGKIIISFASPNSINQKRGSYETDK